MNTCRCKYKIIDYLYGELRDKNLNDFENHLKSCGDCAHLLNQYLQTKRLLSKRSQPSPQAELLNSYHQNLRKIFRGENFIYRWFQLIKQYIVVKPPIAIRLAEIVLILIIGIFIGKSLYNLKIPYSIEKQNILDTRFLNNYLFETELLLLGISNLDNNQDLEFVLKDIDCKMLLQKTLLLKEETENTKNPQLSKLLNKMEFILMELANLDKINANELNFVRNNIRDWHIIIELKSFTKL